MLSAVCCAHGIQDGLVALQFVLFPVIAQAFGLSYTQIGLLKAVSNSAMAALEIPAGILAERVGEKRLLCAGLLGASAGYLGISVSTSFPMLLIFFFVAGAGAAFQHSLSSSLVVKWFTGGGRRKALGTYNSSGDAGKLAFTAAFSALIGMGLGWNVTIVILALAAIVAAGLLWLWIPHTGAESQTEQSTDSKQAPGNWGILKPAKFWSLAVAILLDSIVQAVFLTFIAFVMIEKGFSPALASISVVLTLAGGMVGKFACGFLAARLGDRYSFLLVQSLTVAGLIMVIYLPATVLLVALPLIGLVVQGSSTICYGAVADYVDDKKQSRGYAVIYSFAGLASVIGPFALGVVADEAGLDTLLWCLVITTALTFAMCYSLDGRRTDISQPA